MHLDLHVRELSYKLSSWEILQSKTKSNIFVLIQSNIFKEKKNKNKTILTGDHCPISKMLKYFQFQKYNIKCINTPWNIARCSFTNQTRPCNFELTMLFALTEQRNLS